MSIQEFVDSTLRNLPAASRSYVRSWVRYCSDHHVPVASPLPSQAQAWKDSLPGDGRHAANAVSVIRRMYSHMVAVSLVTSNPFDGVAVVMRARAADRSSMVSLPDVGDPRVALIMQMVSETAMTLSEVVEVPFECLGYSDSQRRYLLGNRPISDELAGAIVTHQTRVNAQGKQRRTLLGLTLSAASHAVRRALGVSLREARRQAA